MRGRIQIMFVTLMLMLSTIGCHVLDNDGLSSNDELAEICGVLGIIMFLSGLGDAKKYFWITVVGAGLLIAWGAYSAR